MKKPLVNSSGGFWRVDGDGKTVQSTSRYIFNVPLGSMGFRHMVRVAFGAPET